jgi:hypothetical protein
METELKTYSSDMLDLAAVPSEDWHKAKYLAANASENELVDEIIDLKRKLNTMVRIANILNGVLDPRKWRDTFPEADQFLWNQLVAQGYGGDEVPE